MMKYAICNETFQGWEWPETCRAIAETGYTGVEIAPFTLTEDVRTFRTSARQQCARIAQDYGLEVIGLHWLLVSPKGLSITGPDESIRRETAEYLAALVDCCADLGGTIMVLGSPAQRRLPFPESNTGAGAVELATTRLHQCLQPALRRAERHHITLCLEPLPAPEADFIQTLHEAYTLLRRFDHPCLKTMFDIKSASSESAPLPGLIREYAPQIAHVHANDANRRGPGFGDTDYKPILATLQEVGYSGYISVEVFDYTPDPMTIARESLRYMHDSE